MIFTTWTLSSVTSSEMETTKRLKHSDIWVDRCKISQTYPLMTPVTRKDSYIWGLIKKMDSIGFNIERFICRAIARGNHSGRTYLISKRRFYVGAAHTRSVRPRAYALIENWTQLRMGLSQENKIDRIWRILKTKRSLNYVSLMPNFVLPFPIFKFSTHFLHQCMSMLDETLYYWTTSKYAPFDLSWPREFFPASFLRSCNNRLWEPINIGAQTH